MEHQHKTNKQTNDMTTTNTLNLKVAQSLVLCHFATTAPATTALNRSATNRAIGAAGADKDAARLYNTVLASKGTAVGKAISLQQRTGVAVRRFGMLCQTGGFYLRVRDVGSVQNVFDDAQAELDVIREDILQTYPELMAQVTRKLAGFGGEVTIPSATDVASRFTMRLSIINQPVAVNESVLTGLSEEVANRVRADSKRQIEEDFRAAHAGPVRDMKKVIEDFADAMRNADRLHLTQFTKLRDEAKRLKNLNFLDLPEIDSLVRAVSEAGVSPIGTPTMHERNIIATKAVKAISKADETLAALGL
jgi:hypothetical protein